MPSAMIEPIIDARKEGLGSHIIKRSTAEESDEQPRRNSSHDSPMSPARGPGEKPKDRRKSRRLSVTGSVVSHSNKSKTKSSSSSRRSTVTALPEEQPMTVRRRHRRTQSHQITASSSEDDDEPEQDHRKILAAPKAHLMTPSIISTLTCLTTATNNSGGSSGSNSTITQTTLSRHSPLQMAQEGKEAMPLSPAVPDAPDVFAYLETDSSDDDDMEEEVGMTVVKDEESHHRWGATVEEADDDATPLPTQLSFPSVRSASSSSTSSSLNSDDTSEHASIGNETDRSSSPERSAHASSDDESQERPITAIPSSPSAAKFEAQMQAARQRQSLHNAYQSFGTPQMPRGNANHPHVPPTMALSPRNQNMQPRSLPRGEKLPITGYEAIASALSSQSKFPIQPIYRKFQALNNRLLLHLQDELSELEEQLHRLDNADTQSRTVAGPPSPSATAELRILPASRRASAHVGGELEWHKSDLVNKIAFKLSQYNGALTSFNSVAQRMESPDSTMVDQYRKFLQRERPIVQAETRFLDLPNDLVAIGTVTKPIMAQESLTAKTSVSSGNTSQFTTLAFAVAAAVLIPILTFVVIPGFIGRMTVTMLVALGVVGASAQSGVIGSEIWGRDGAICGIVYGVGMVIIAGVVV